ncbi:MAG: transcription termination factor NusA, partial [Anaerolineae bacterium]|nr:transcription termination factor NusA [Anaerolineae bacterium]
MKTDFIRAINQVCAERGLTIEVVLEALEQALVSAQKRDSTSNEHLQAKIDPATGEVRMFTGQEVVEIVEDPVSQIELAQAKKINPEAELGEIIFQETTPPDFGRIAAQTAKQVILQRIREAERDALYESYVGREGEIVSGTVHSIDSRGITVNLGRIEALVPRSQQVPNERYYIRQKIRILILEVNRTSRGPEIIGSRSHPDMLRRLLEVEVPEIYNGLVQIRAIAREAGSRAKVAVAALQIGIDPVGACVGMRGVRIQSIVSELNGEKIDVIPWIPDPKEFIAKSLSPARPLGVELSEHDEMGRTATVIVPDNELSLAIGREGQNARLAAKLTGWRIDIIGATEAAERAVRRVEREAARAAARGQISEDMPLDKLGLSGRVLNALRETGIAELGQLVDKVLEGDEPLLEIKGLGQKSLQEIKETLERREVFPLLGRKPRVEEKEPEPEASVAEEEPAAAETGEDLASPQLSPSEPIAQETAEVSPTPEEEQAAPLETVPAVPTGEAASQPQEEPGVAPDAQP